jgi:HEAT repeat protein
MQVTMEDVIRYLSPDEPDLRGAAAALGPNGLPYLETLVKGDDMMLAANAAYVAGLIQDPRAIGILQLAASSANKPVRVAVAATAVHLPPSEMDLILSELLTDKDPEIRRLAIEAVPSQVLPGTRKALERLVQIDSYPFLRDLSVEILQRIAKP